MIGFGADGWRARVDGDFTEDNVIRIADAAGKLWARSAPGAIVYVGFDTRPGAEHFACLAGKVLASHGLVPKVSDRFAPTPAVVWAVARDQRACGGFQVTGSHSPHDYLGVKIRMASGGLPTADEVAELERLIDARPTSARGAIQRSDIVAPYFDYLCSVVDGDAIAAANLKVVFDPLYGAVRGYLPIAMGALGIDVTEIHGADDEGTSSIHPDPIEPWVDDCEQAVVACAAQAGFITDGDGDRMGAVDERGRYVASHKIVALVAGHLVKRHGLSGRVVVDQSMSVLVRRAAEALGCRITVKPVGFGHLFAEMVKGDVLIAGEEAGGVGIPAYCPERDGILVALLLAELMATSAKTLGELVDELEDDLGKTSYGRRDLRLEAGAIETFRMLLPGLNPHDVAGEVPVRVSHMDGIKMELADESWLLLRPSGTEPVVRVYAESTSVERRDQLLEAGSKIAHGHSSDS